MWLETDETQKDICTAPKTPPHWLAERAAWKTASRGIVSKGRSSEVVRKTLKVRVGFSHLMLDVDACSRRASKI
jgi:hypothetical protein